MTVMTPEWERVLKEDDLRRRQIIRKRLGFKKVFDTNYAADLTIMEEANEFIEENKIFGKISFI